MPLLGDFADILGKQCFQTFSKAEWHEVKQIVGMLMLLNKGICGFLRQLHLGDSTFSFWQFV